MGHGFTLYIFLTVSTILGFEWDSEAYITEVECFDKAEVKINFLIQIGVYDVQGGDVCYPREMTDE